MGTGTIRRFGATALIALVCTTLAPTGVALAAPSITPSALPSASHDSWVVTLRNGVDPQTSAPGLARAAGGKAGLVYTHALNGFVFKGSAQGARALARNPNVRTVVPDGAIKIAADGIPTGVGRIAAEHPTLPDAHEAGFNGAGTRIAVLDTGIDLTHPDLAASLDLGLGLNCMTDPAGSSPPQDGHGHGTHVAGIAAAPLNGVGVIGVAPQARIVPIKVLDDTGYGEWSNLICGIDHLTALNTDGDPSNDVDVANMSLGDTGTIGTCSDGFVREAICHSVASGITYVAAAGNSTVDTSTFIPAAMPEVIAVSSLTDLDGQPGGLGGCLLWIFYCDDTLSEFSNYGPDVEVAAPGFEIYSDWTGGGYQSESGTSMASPHVTGVAALVRSANPALGPADVSELLKEAGECPNGTFADADGSGNCVGKGQWGNDPDGYGEPVVNALRAAQAASAWVPKPTISITSPADGSTVSGLVTVTASASSAAGMDSVAFAVNGATLSTDTDGSDGWSFDWDTSAFSPGVYSIRGTATDSAGQQRSADITVNVGTNPQGDWVGNYGADGYVLSSWYGTSGDLVGLPAGVTYTLEQGGRTNSWIAPTTDVRALESPDQSERRARTWYDPARIRVQLAFAGAYSGTLHLYAVDWDATARREDITVDDGAGARAASLTTAFVNGAWLHFPISVPAGGSVAITIDNRAGSSTNAILSGLFLGGSAVAPTLPGAPTGLAATPGNGQVALAWLAPSSDGGSAITSYTATASPGGATCTTAGLGCTITGLANGTSYSFTVKATNAIGTGPASSPVSATPATVPGAPTDLAATPGNGQVALAWLAPASNGGSAITSYTATASPGGATCTTAGLGCTITGLTNGTSYSFTVKATNAIGGGPASSPVSATPATVPGAPTGLAATPGNGQVALTWIAPASNGGSAITSYTATASPGGATCSTATLGCTITGLTNGTPYSFTVKATNVIGTGPASSPVSATPVAPATLPGAPTGLAATPGNGQVALAWLAPSSDGGSAITSYTATASPGGATCTTAGLGCTITGLTNGTSYSFTVKATNAIGTGPASSPVSATPATVPGAPTDLAATPGNGQVALAWLAPASNGGSAITSYTATASPGGATCTTAGLGCTITGLTNGTSYSFTVKATNAIGGGPASSPVSATPATVPGAPTNVSASALRPSGIRVTWATPTSNGGSTITGYRIYRSTTSGAETLYASVGVVTTYTDNATTSGVRYYYQVAAVNAIGVGARSAQTNARAK